MNYGLSKKPMFPITIRCSLPKQQKLFSSPNRNSLFNTLTTKIAETMEAEPSESITNIQPSPSTSLHPPIFINSVNNFDLPFKILKEILHSDD